jgi:flagellar basal-body rod modification protein FlgD
MSTTPVGSSGSTASNLLPASASTDPFQTVDLNSFLKLMITELQNQDPLNPMDNSQILAQIGQMQNISSMTKLSQTLDGVALGQSLTSASILISSTITGLDDDGNDVTGQVDKVTMVDGAPKLDVGGKLVSLSNIKEVLPPGAAN